jgi:hypothetical protein
MGGHYVAAISSKEGWTIFDDEKVSSNTPSTFLLIFIHLPCLSYLAPHGDVKFLVFKKEKNITQAQTISLPENIQDTPDQRPLSVPQTDTFSHLTSQYPPEAATFLVPSAFVHSFSVLRNMPHIVPFSFKLEAEGLVTFEYLETCQKVPKELLISLGTRIRIVNDIAKALFHLLPRLPNFIPEQEITIDQLVFLCSI